MRALRTGELHLKGSVVRRSDSSVIFYFLIGLLLFFAAAMLDMLIGFGVLMKLVNLRL